MSVFTIVSGFVIIVFISVALYLLKRAKIARRQLGPVIELRPRWYEEGRWQTWISVASFIISVGSMGFTGVTALQTKRQAEAAERALEDARLTNERTNCARIGLLNIVATFKVKGVTPRVRWQMENFGNTPAEHFVMGSKYWYDNDMKPDPFVNIPPDKFDDLSKYPRTETIQPHQMIRYSSPIDQSKLAGIENGSIRLIWYVAYEFDDVYKKRHGGKECYIYDPAKKALGRVNALGSSF